MSKKASILVVDDEPHVLKLVKANLESSGYKVLTAEDGEHALRLVENERPDLIVLDLMLPKMDGYAVCRRIREFSPVPVIMLTARSAQVDLVHGFEVGADDYLTKPFSVTELLMRVQAVLRRSKWPEYRKAGVTELVRDVYQRAKRAKPDAQVTAAVFSSLASAENLFQDCQLRKLNPTTKHSTGAARNGAAGRPAAGGPPLVSRPATNPGRRRRRC